MRLEAEFPNQAQRGRGRQGNSDEYEPSGLSIAENGTVTTDSDTVELGAPQHSE